jgi:transcriptional regulator with XRE-family HTH domain
VTSLCHVGPLLIALRISKGWTQHELAQRLGVTDAAVSRDENNEYHGIGLERAQRILETLGASVQIQVASALPTPAGT